MKVGAFGCFYITPHALGRYIKRHRRDLAPAAALHELRDITTRAERVRTFEDGHELWRGPKRAPVPRLLFLVGPRSEGALPAVVTIPNRPRLTPKPDNHRARYRAARRAVHAARPLTESPQQEDA